MFRIKPKQKKPVELQSNGYTKGENRLYGFFALVAVAFGLYFMIIGVL